MYQSPGFCNKKKTGNNPFFHGCGFGAGGLILPDIILAYYVPGSDLKILA